MSSNSREATSKTKENDEMQGKTDAMSKGVVKAGTASKSKQKPKMTLHDQSSPDSRQLCGTLFHKLSERYGEFEPPKFERYCKFGLKGQKLLVWIEHRKTIGGIWVHFYGEVDDPSKYPSLKFIRRKPPTGGHISFPQLKFMLDRTAQLPDAVKLICRNPYPR